MERRTEARIVMMGTLARSLKLEPSEPAPLRPQLGDTLEVKPQMSELLSKLVFLKLLQKDLALRPNDQFLCFFEERVHNFGR